MIGFLIDNIFVQFGGCLFLQVIGISMETYCDPLLADLFLYSYENEFLDNMIKVAIGDLPGHLIYAIDPLMIWLFLIRSSWIISTGYIHPS